MNKIGLHFGYLRGTPYENDVPAAMAAVKEAGADALEIPAGSILPMSRTARRELRAAAADLGLTLTMTGSMSAGTDIAASDPGIRAEGISFAREVLGAAADIGAETWGGVNYQAWLGRPEELLTPESKGAAWDRSAEALRAILSTAEDLGVDYCFEVVNRFEGYLLNTAAEALAYVRDVGSPRAKVLLDTYHMNIEEDSITDAMEAVLAAGKLGHFHVGESNRRIPGTGRTHMPWEDIFRTLRAGGYQGAIVMEPFVRMGLPSSANTCTWRDLTENRTLADYMGDVTRGAAYIREHLR